MQQVRQSTMTIMTMTVTMTNQYQEHVYNERDILRGCRHMFISR